MKLRAFLVLITIIGIIVFIVLVISFVLRPDLLKDPLLFWGTIGVAIVAVLSASYYFISITKHYRDLYQKIEEGSALQETTLQRLVEGLGKGGEIKWVDRGVTNLSALKRCRAIAITGQTKTGKTREAVELIRSLVKYNPLIRKRIYIPNKRFIQVYDEKMIRDSVAKNVNAGEPVVLFIDDLPYHYRGDDLIKLGKLIEGLKSHCKEEYVIITARTDQIKINEEEYQGWFDKNKINIKIIGQFNPGQIGDIVDSAAEVYKVRLEGASREILMDGCGGSAEVINIAFQRFTEHGKGTLDDHIAPSLVRESVQDSWAFARLDIQKRIRGSQALFLASGAFHAAQVTPYQSLVLAYANDLWGKEAEDKPWLRMKMLRSAMDDLQHYDFVVENHILRYKDAAIENQDGLDRVVEQLPKFLLRYRKMCQNAVFRHVYPAARDHAWSLFDIGNKNFEKGNYQLAEKCYSTGLKLVSYFGYYYNRGLVYAEQGEYAKAGQDYSRAIELDPQYTAAYNNRGITCAKQGEYEKAVQDYSRAIELDPQHVLAYYNRGITYVKQWEIEKAMQDFSRAIELDPQYALAYYNRGLVYTKQGEYEKAVQDYSRVIELDPQDTAACYKLARVYALLEDVLPACEWLEKAIRIDIKCLEVAEEDKDFDQIRQTSEFKSLIANYRPA